MPYGIPMIVIHHRIPDKTHAIPLTNPPNMNQQILPNNRIYNYSALYKNKIFLHILCKFHMHIKPQQFLSELRQIIMKNNSLHADI